MVAASTQEPHPPLDALSMRRLEERFRTEIVVAERWSDAYRAERELRRAQALLQGPSPLVNKPKVRRERPARARMDLARISPTSPRDKQREENATTAAIPLTRARR